MSDQEFERSPQPFFSGETTKKSVAEIVKRQHIIVYCGAGVTIDRTGLGWKKLISSALRPTKPENRDDLYISEADIEALPQLIDAQRLATILTGYCEVRYPKQLECRSKIHNWLRNELYEQSGWQSGALATNIARYAVAATSIGSQVTLITTNYDIYLEKEIQKELSRIRTRTKPAPSYKKHVLGPRVPNSYPSADINLVYLHGRLPESASPQGTIVVDELDYAETRSRTVEVLLRYLRLADSALVIVGASLTDPPLIEALALDADNKRKGAQYRVYLTPISSFGISGVDGDTMARLIEHIGSRCVRLGLDKMLPVDFKFQTAQFFEELAVCTVNGAREYLKADSKFAYDQRLLRWWESWSVEAATAENTIGVHRNLRKKVRDIAADYRNARNDESFKLEIWARDDVRNKRQLKIWASSMGIPMDRTTMKRADLAVNSSRATVRSFTEGRVMHLGAAELGLSKDSYWQSFLAVPIYLDRDDMRLFAGAITLVSSCAKDQTALPNNDVGKMQNLVKDLTDLGERALDVQLT
ncbi:SIR2 family protein [Mycobacterium sp. Aquia_213]|uniref:SIR2 family protein n=1 Tax=Mycobacterium sp. Aquia_213 TaxID=2991728 RepID=UPI00226FA4DE|nr:SIR2 family protein [Mycobacterium sp. Aquia_213]WAC90199.1 SIR2 family protein [Mycobacterium sp. Aquia_213]